MLTSAERHNAGPEVAGVERHVDTREGNSREATFKDNVALLRLQLLRLRVARVDDLSKHLLDLVDRELLSQLGNKVSIHAITPDT